MIIMATNEQKKTSIGGQALIEGLMMKGPHTSAMAIRTSNGEIDLETWETNKGGKRPWYKTTPFIRGTFNLIDTLREGYSCLMKSAEKADFDLDEPSAFDRKLEQWFGENAMKIISVVAMVIAVALSVLLFMVIPAAISKALAPWLTGRLSKSAVEGIIKIVIFLLYVALVSRTNDIYRVFQYHGAEHKTIACYEAGLPLTVENIRGQCRFHPRCGTSFLLIVLVVSILVFSVVTWDNLIIRVLLKFALLPVTVGISYEIIKFAGRHDNVVTRIISAPGMWLQRLTTNEPDDSMIECAIAAMEPCIPENANDDNY